MRGERFQVTGHVGEPVRVREGESAADFAERVRQGMQALIDTHQKRRSRYLITCMKRLRSAQFKHLCTNRAHRSAARMPGSTVALRLCLPVSCAFPFPVEGHGRKVFPSQKPWSSSWRVLTTFCAVFTSSQRCGPCGRDQEGYSVWLPSMRAREGQLPDSWLRKRSPGPPS
jgi:hypothetical protein